MLVVSRAGRTSRFAAGVAAIALLVAASAAAQAPVEHGGSAGTLEGRPTAARVSPLQARVDSAAPGATVVVEPGTYRGDIYVDRPLRLVGRGRPQLIGSGTGSVVLVRAPDVTIDGFDIDGLGGGDLGRDASGIHVAAPRATIHDCRLRNTLFGVYLREAHDARVIGCAIRGIPGKDPGEKGSGIHLWNTERFRVERNVITGVRDGIYIQSSSNGLISGNDVRDMRYGLHYMFSDDNVFEDNLFQNGDAGSAIMYSRRITFRRNRFVHNRGFASVGLLFQQCDDVVAEDNLVVDNARGVFLEGSYRDVFRRNVIAASDVAVVLYTSNGAVRFEGNSFVGNLSPLTLVGKRTDTVFEGNYWSDNDEPDLDGDGRTDRPYRLSNVFDHLRDNLTAADLMAQGLAAAALAAAENAFPVLAPVSVEDPRPLARPPALPDVPGAVTRVPAANHAGLLAAALVLASGCTILGSAGRRRRGETQNREPRADHD